MTEEELRAEFAGTLKWFKYLRAKHGGVMLPDRVIAEGAFHDAMVDAGLYDPPKLVPIIGSSNG